MAQNEPLQKLDNASNLNHEKLTKIWENQDTLKNVGAKWDSWSSAVRLDFLKRVQNSVLASVQITVPRKKEWQQWEITLKFCLNDIFARARETAQLKYKDPKGIHELLRMILEKKENVENAADFEKRIDEMLNQMNPGLVPNFNKDDTAHKMTLKTIRSIYCAEWALNFTHKILI